MNMLFLHGWGLKHSIWNEVDLSLANIDKKMSPCLYDVARKSETSSLESIALQLSETIEPDTIIVAWSIGGLIAIPLQKFTNNIKAIVFVTSSPCFVNQKAWQNVIDKSNIESLQQSLQNDTEKTLEYFSGLIAHGDIKPKETNKTIRQHLANICDKEVLSSWLAQMITTDFRNKFSEISCPALVVLAENDSLINSSIEKELKLLNNNIETKTIKDCGHAPFLSKQKETATIIKGFINAKLG